MFDGCSEMANSDKAIPTVAKYLHNAESMFEGSGLSSGGASFLSKWNGKYSAISFDNLSNAKAMFRNSGLVVAAEDSAPIIFPGKQTSSTLTSIESMFEGCRGLNDVQPTIILGTINHSGHYDIPVGTVAASSIGGIRCFNGLFRNCSNLSAGDISFLSNDVDIASFYGPTADYSVSGVFAKNRLFDMGGMFENCASMTSLSGNLPRGLGNSERMFKNCTSLDIDIDDILGGTSENGYYTYIPSSISEMFYNCGKIHSSAVSAKNKLSDFAFNMAKMLVYERAFDMDEYSKLVPSSYMSSMFVAPPTGSLVNAFANTNLYVYGLSSSGGETQRIPESFIPRTDLSSANPRRGLEWEIKTENIDSASVGISGETLSTDLFNITACPIPALPCRITLRDGFTAYAGTLVDEPDKFLRIRFYPVFDNDRMLRGFKAWSPSGTISSMHPANASEGEYPIYDPSFESSAVSGFITGTIRRWDNLYAGEVVDMSSGSTSSSIIGAWGQTEDQRITETVSGTTHTYINRIYRRMNGTYVDNIDEVNSSDSSFTIPGFGSWFNMDTNEWHIKE